MCLILMLCISEGLSKLKTWVNDFYLESSIFVFYGFKTFVKFQLINKYADGCYDTFCITCHINIAMR